MQRVDPACASVVDDPLVRDALSDPSVLVVWLRVSATTAARRMITGDHRPRPEAMEAQAARRDPWFAAVADLTVDADAAARAGGPSAFEDVVETVRQRLAQSG